MRRSTWCSVIPGLLIALLATQPQGHAAKASAKSRPRAHVATMKLVVEKVPPHRYAEKASPKSRARAIAATVKPVVEKPPGSVQIVTFPDTDWHPVKIIRGGATAKETNAEVPPAEKPAAAELVTFADPNTHPVRVLRGDGEHPAATAPSPQTTGMHSELVTFVDPRFRPVTVLRGSAEPSSPAIGLFAPAREADLDRVAFAVEGAESSHGTDPRMWGPGFSGPQGPMQVSAAAAADVGGGNRFDIFENRMLGRGYLALMYRRYGNWPDAIAAYNWGPGNMDAWIGSGRPSASFPLEVERYRDRVLRSVGLDRTVAALLFSRSGQIPAIPVLDARSRATVATPTR
jgi:transglycosylase-like protein with SLT domain